MLCIMYPVEIHKEGAVSCNQIQQSAMCTSCIYMMCNVCTVSSIQIQCTKIGCCRSSVLSSGAQTRTSTHSAAHSPLCAALQQVILWLSNWSEASFKRSQLSFPSTSFLVNQTCCSYFAKIISGWVLICVEFGKWIWWELDRMSFFISSGIVMMY